MTLRLLLCALLAGCGGQAVPGPTTASAGAGIVRSADATALQAALGANHVPVLIDVRSPGEYSAGHVPGALNIPVDQLPSRAAELENYRQKGEVWLICESGGRSARAAQQLSGKGFATVNVADGTAGWRALGLPLE
jgi:rhodanese-related sulfurtransferase